MSERKLATIRKIKNIEPIPGADKIDLATIDGWKVVVKKDEFCIGDLCVYFEIDSVLPPVDPFLFMATRKYRVRTIKLRGQISQGLVLPLSYFNNIKTGEGTDVTKLLNITKYENETLDRDNTQQRNKFVDTMCKFTPTRKLFTCYRYLFKPKTKGAWPEWFSKTDEERVQNMKYLKEDVFGRNLYATEKLDGQSFTAFYKGDERVGLFKKGLFGVCSRNIWFKRPHDTYNNWCDIARFYRLNETLSSIYKNTGNSLVIQGEIIGPNIQHNRYGLNSHKLYVYNIYHIESDRYYTFAEREQFCWKHNLIPVPIVSDFIKCTTIDEFLQLADGKSSIYNVNREGIVIRDKAEDKFSFKAISNKWLLKNE